MSCQRARSARASTPRSANSRKTAIGGVASNNQARSFQSSCKGCCSSPAMGSSFDGLVVQCILPLLLSDAATRPCTLLLSPLRMSRVPDPS